MLRKKRRDNVFEKMLSSTSLSWVLLIFVAFTSAMIIACIGQMDLVFAVVLWLILSSVFEVAHLLWTLRKQPPAWGQVASDAAHVARQKY